MVYTPFVRVALHARAASERGTTILRTEVPAAALEPVAYLAFNWKLRGGEETEHFNKNSTLRIAAIFDPSVTRDMVAATRAMNAPRARPLWIRQDTAPLRDLGIAPPPHVEAVAAFGLDVLNTAPRFRIVRTSTDLRTTGPEFVAPVPEDFRRWR